MASNAKIKARKEKTVAKREAASSKFVDDLNKIRKTGAFPIHYVGGGQPFTRGKTNEDEDS